MRRLSVFLGVAGLVLVGSAASPGRSAVSLTVTHEGNPPQLLLPRDAAEVEYVIGTAGVLKPTGTLFVRRDGQSSFTPLPLRLGFASGRHPRLYVTLPRRFLQGKRLFYYAQLQDPASGASLTIPAQGADAPQASWILHRPVTVKLGRYRFGHLQAAEAVVARAPTKKVGWDLRSQRGPTTFLVGRDRSIWLLDTLNNRMLVWRAGKPNSPVRSVPLPTEGRHDVAFQDVAFGPGHTLYVTRAQAWTVGFQIFRIDATTGAVLWKISSYAATGWDGLPAWGVPLWVGPDGALYACMSNLDLELYGAPEYGWMPLATPTGTPIPPTAQFEQIVWGHEPLSGGRRFIAENYLPPHARYSPRDARFAVLDRYGRLIRSWRVASKSSIPVGYFFSPQLLNRGVVAEFLKSAGPGKSLEHFVIRLGNKGLDGKASLPYRLWGGQDSSDLRIGPNGKIYALSTSPKTGVVVRRYNLG